MVSDETRASVTFGNVDPTSPRRPIFVKGSAEVPQGPNPGFVRFYVYEAVNLMAKDASGTSDPFVTFVNTVDIEGKECRTKVQKKTLSPKWNEGFTFMVPNMDRWALRLQLWDWDVLGKDKLGYVDILGSQAQQPKVTFNVVEGSGSVAVGWSVSKTMPDEGDEEVEHKVAMPAERRGRLRVHAKSASGLARPCASVVRLVDGALDADVTSVAENTDAPEWGEWLEIDVPDLASWVIQLNVLERTGPDETLLGTVSLQADKFNLGGSPDYKTLALSGGPGELTVGVAPVREFKKLAQQIARAKAAMQAEEGRRARLRTKTLMQAIGGDGRYAGDVIVKLLDVTGPEPVTIFATVEGVLTPTHEAVKTRPFHIGDPKGWEEVFFLHLPDAGNFSFVIHLWEHAPGPGITKIFGSRDQLLGTVTIGSLDVDLTVPPDAPRPAAFRCGPEGKLAVRVEVTPTLPMHEVALRIKAEADAAAALPLAWPEERAGVLRVHALRGDNLAVADIGGTSDPYVQISGVFDMHGEPVKSRVIKKTLNPYWDQWFDIPVPDLASFDFTLGIWDQDVAMDDTLGFVALRSEDDWNFAEAEQRKKMTVMNGSGTVEIGLAPTLHSRRVLRQIRAAKAAGLAPVSAGGLNKMVRARFSGVLQLSIISARGLLAADRNGLSDPYCMVPKGFLTDTRGREIRTKVIRKTLTPEWNEVFEFWVPDVREFHFQISVWDWDLGKHDSLGFAVVRSQDFLEFQNKGRQRKLLQIEDGEGELFVELAASEAAQRVLDQVREEKEEQERQRLEEERRVEREAHLRQMCRERLQQLRDKVPLYDRKIAFDPFLIVAAVLLVLFLLNMAWTIYQHGDSIVAVALWPVRTGKVAGLAVWRAALWTWHKVRSLI